MTAPTPSPRRPEASPLPIACAISAVAHGAIIVALVRMASAAGPSLPPDRDESANVDIELVDLAMPLPPDIVPMEIAVIPRPTPAPAPELATPALPAPPAPAAEDPAAARELVAARTELPTALTAAPPAPTEASEPTSSGALAMRGHTGGSGERRTGDPGRGAGPDDGIALGLPSSVTDRIAQEPIVPRDEVAPTGQLKPAGGGWARKRDLTFEADVAPDGSVVAIRDKPNFHAHLAVPRPGKIGKVLGDHLDAWNEDPQGTATGVPMKRPTHADAAHVDEDEDRAGVIPLIGGGFDLTDWAMRSSGQDPYAARKRAFLDETRAERVEMYKRHRTQQLAATTQTVRGHLDRLWARTDLTLAGKKQALCELWDDGVERGDAAVVDAARRARVAVVGFIRAHLPAGGPDAYTVAELDACNARRTSKLRFDPYGEQPVPPAAPAATP